MNNANTLSSNPALTPVNAMGLERHQRGRCTECTGPPG